MVSMVPVIHPQNVLPREAQLLELVLPHLESVVSSPSLVEEVVVPITPMPSSLPTLQALIQTPVPTHSVKLTQMCANLELILTQWFLPRPTPCQVQQYILTVQE